MSRDGMPIAHHVFPGNTPDADAFMEAIRDLKSRFNIQRVIVVGGSGNDGKTDFGFAGRIGSSVHSRGENA